MENYPNPFNLETLINYGLSFHALVNITIFDIHGRKVNEILNVQHHPGSYYIIWDGLDQHAKRLPNGIYFYRIVFKSKSDSFSQVKKITLLR